ncbi:MAG: hypothetical protein ACK4YU_15255, partial [Paracoccus sp. (in: a-proteobacteria)]
RMYLETMEQVLADVQKIILGEGENGSQSVVPYLPLDQLRGGAPSASRNQPAGVPSGAGATGLPAGATTTTGGTN